jgi:hypothetical protein
MRDSRNVRKGEGLCLAFYRISIAKVIAIRALSTPTAVKGLAYFFLTLRRIHYPSPGLPRRLVAQVLGMAAGKHGNPVPVFILTKAGDRRAFRSDPSVRVLFAFGRLLR